MESKREAKSFEEKASRYLIFIAFGYFLLRLFYFAVNISHDIPPDEVTRFGICQIFSKTRFLPENSEATYELGLITHIPYLYYFIMGKLLTLNLFPVSDLVFLRLINCLFSLFTVIYGLKWMRMLTQNPFCHALFVFIITNTPMFSFIGASVSYDNLTNLFAATAIYYLHLFFQTRRKISFLQFVISLLGGSLTKTSFLPLILVYLGIFSFHERKNLRSIWSLIKQNISSMRYMEIGVSGIAVLLLGLNFSLYVGNLVHFGKLTPRINQVLTEEQSIKYRLFARGRITFLYRSGQITFDEAVRKANEIQHPGDRNDTLFLLKRARLQKRYPVLPLDRIQYTWSWLKLMLQRTVSVTGHKLMPKGSYAISIYQIVFLFSFVSFIRFWKPDDAAGYLMDAFVVCLFYTLVLSQFVNYRKYLYSLEIGLALQGRYFFPVIIPFYGIVTYFLINPFKRPAQIFLFFIVSFTFILGDFPYFLHHATPQWFF